MLFEEFEEIVTDSVQRLPAAFRELLEKNGIAVIARDKAPSPVKRSYRGQTVFGIFIGTPFGRDMGVQAFEPTRIELYKDSFERSFDSGEEMRRQILMTVVHEVGHYFGFSEKELRKLGY